MFSNQIKDWKSELVSYNEYHTRDFTVSAIQQHLSYEMNTQNKLIVAGTAGVVHSNQEIAASNQEIVQRISDSTSLVCGTLERGFESLIECNLQGFESISNDLSKVYSKLSDISGILDWGFAQTIEQLKTANVLLGNIAELLRIPDIQKERQYHVEQGLKFYQNARSDTDFYRDSLENFIQAQEIEATDYFVLQRLGLIHMFSIEHLSIEKSLQYFLKSAKYSAGEMHEHSSRSTNVLELKTNSKFSDNLKTILDVKRTTAQSWLYAARCYYIQEEYQLAADYAKKAVEISYNIQEGGFDLAKYYSRLGRMSECIEILEIIVKENKFILQKVVLDFDLASKKEVEVFIRNITSEAKNELNELSSRINPKPAVTKTNKDLLNIISTVEDYVSADNYINSRLGIELLTNSQSLKLEFLNQESDEGFIYNPNVESKFTSPIQAVEYINFTKDKIPKFFEFHNLVDAKSDLVKEIAERDEEIKVLRKSNEQHLGNLVIGIVLTAVGVFFLILFLTVLGQFIKLLTFIALAVLFYHGIVRIFQSRPHIKFKVESNLREIHFTKCRELNEIETRITELENDFQQMKLEKLIEIL